MQLLLASTGPEVFEASCCHNTNLLLRASSRAMARYTADSGITIKKLSGKGKDGHRERGKGGEGVMGWWGTSRPFMLRHMSRIRRKFFVS